MARGTTFGQLIEMVRLEAGMDPNPAMSTNIVPLLEHSIRREYERLYDDFDWPFLRVTRDVTLNPGQRYYDFPNDLDLDRIETVEVWWGSRWFPLERRIDMAQYNVYDSDADVRVDPAQRWDVTDTGDESQMEIWPIPAMTGRIRITGIRRMTRLVTASDRCDLDDMMIALYASAMLLARRGAKDAGAKLQEAKARYDTVKERSKQTATNSFSFTGKKDNSVDRPALVAYVRNPT